MFRTHGQAGTTDFQSVRRQRTDWKSVLQSRGAVTLIELLVVIAARLVTRAGGEVVTVP